MDSGKILFSKGMNDECYTPQYGVLPIIDFLDLKYKETYVDIYINKIDKNDRYLFEGQYKKLKVQTMGNDCISVEVPMFNKKGFYQLDGDGTDRYVIEKEQVNKIFELRNITIRCPFDKENSEFVIQLEKKGYNVIHSHIDEGKDFFNYEPKKRDVIISNPPFTNKRKIFERCISFGKPFALLMSNTRLNDAAPKQLFKNRELQLLMFDKRIEFDQRKKITFSSSYFCFDLLPKQIIMYELKK